MNNIENILYPIKNILNKSSKLLNFYQFKSFLEKINLSKPKRLPENTLKI